MVVRVPINLRVRAHRDEVKFCSLKCLASSHLFEQFKHHLGGLNSIIETIHAVILILMTALRVKKKQTIPTIMFLSIPWEQREAY